MQDAIARQLTLLEKFPNNDLARFSLGKAYYDAADFARAREQFSLALARKSDWMAAWVLLGKSDLALGDRAAARTAFTRAHQLALEQNHEGPRLEMEECLAGLQ